MLAVTICSRQPNSASRWDAFAPIHLRPSVGVKRAQEGSSASGTTDSATFCGIAAAADSIIILAVDIDAGHVLVRLREDSVRQPSPELTKSCVCTVTDNVRAQLLPRYGRLGTKGGGSVH